MSEPFDFEGETDLELLGGTTDDEPAPKVDEPAPVIVAPKAEESNADPVADDEVEQHPKRDAVIPRARFDEVNAKLHAEREARSAAEAKLEAIETARRERQSEQDRQKANEINVDTLEDDYFEAVMSGDKDKAREIRAQINSDIFQRAKQASEEVVSTTLSQREIQSTFAATVAKTVEAYPFLDSSNAAANADAIADVVEWRDLYIGKGDSPAVALQKAAAKVAPLYAKEPVTAPVTENPRTKAAIAEAARTAAAQPPANEAGIGNRAIPQGDDLISDQNKWDKATDAERQRLLA